MLCAAQVLNNSNSSGDGNNSNGKSISVRSIVGIIALYIDFISVVGAHVPASWIGVCLLYREADR